MVRTSLIGLAMAMALAAVAPGQAQDSKMSGNAMDKGMGKGMGVKSTTFTVRIEGVSTASTLKLSNGETAPAPVSPGAWVVFTGTNPTFVAGKPDAGMGLEAQAEDGNPEMLAKSIASQAGVVTSGVFNTPVGDDMPGPALPGKKYEFTVTAKPGEKLALTMMFGQSNDLFYAPEGKGIALFDSKGMPMGGNVTSKLVLWDAGTEVNQEPGVGADQAPRQSAPNTGTAEHGNVRRVKDGFKYPATKDVVRVTITPESGMANR